MPVMDKLIKILLADDHLLLRQGLREILQNNFRDIIVREAEDGEDTYHKVMNYKPDIVFLDINMPRKDGLEILKEIKSKVPQTVFVILTMHNNIHYYREAVEAGAKGFLLKTHALAEICECTKMLLAGENYLKGFDELNDIPEDFDKLTVREVKVLKGIIEGQSNRELGQNLFCSEKNIERIKTKMRKKLNLTSSYNSLLFWALRNKEYL
ncbi:response regulator transcription factor [Sinomicrobium sp. M5D2P9]